MPGFHIAVCQTPKSVIIWSVVSCSDSQNADSEDTCQ